MLIVFLLNQRDLSLWMSECEHVLQFGYILTIAFISLQQE